MQITIREPGSAITHFIAMMMAVFAAVPLLVKAAVQSGQENFLAMAIFMGSMILLYGASATYHSVDLTGKSLRVFRKLDHMMIFVLIAGSYTPVCLIVLGGKPGYTLLALVWGIAAVGIPPLRHGRKCLSFHFYVFICGVTISQELVLKAFAQGVVSRPLSPSCHRTLGLAFSKTTNSVVSQTMLRYLQKTIN